MFINQYKGMPMKPLQVLIAIDQTINTIFNGYADETLSSRAYRRQHKNKFWKYGRIFIDTLFFWQEDHCYKAYQSEVERRHYPKEFRD